MKPYLFIASTLLATSANQSLAESKIPTIVISNARYAEPLEEVIGATTVINQDSIEQSPAQTLAELLQSQAGVDMHHLGGAGQETHVRLRGTGNSHTLVLVDGVRVSSADNGYVFWQTLALENIARIEVVRGPKSSLYGSDAIGGVIQIFTKKQSGYRLATTVGSDNTQIHTLSLGFQKKHRGVHITAKHGKSDGFSKTNSAIVNTTFGGVDNPDNDGYQSKSLNLNAWTNIGQKAKLRLTLLDSTVDADHDYQWNPDDDRISYENRLYSMNVKHQLERHWQYSVQISKAENTYQISNASTGVHSTESKVNRWQLHWQHQLTLGKNTLSFGYDRNKDQVQHSSGYGGEIRNQSWYLNYAGSAKNLRYTVGARRDRHETFGSKTTGNIGLKYYLNPQLSLFANYGTAFRAPNMTELYFPNSGNTDLKPETARSSELGVRYANKTHQFSANIFHSKLTDMIDDPAPSYQFINIANARIKGGELSYQYHRPSWHLNTAYTYQEVTDETGNPIDHRPKQKLTIGVQKNHAKGTMRIEGHFFSQQTDLDSRPFPAEKITHPGYGLLHASASYLLQPKLQLQLKVTNLLDKDYTVRHGYNTQGRAAYVTLAYQGGW